MKYNCNLIIPGFPKSGTSSLHSYLDLHESICMSTSKEPHFFNKDDEYEVGAALHNKIFEDESGEFFRYYGESSTTYCISEQACKRIADSLCNVKIIIIMRDPVSRLLSHYNWLSALGFEKLPLRETLKIYGRNFKFQKRWGGNFKSYIQFSEYHKYIPMWESYFGQENILLLKSEDLHSNPENVLKTVWDFLGVQPISINESIENNTTAGIAAKNYPLWMYGLFKIIPYSIKEALTKCEKFTKLFKRVFYKTVKIKNNVTEDDINYVAEILKADIDYYTEKFSGS